MTIAVAEAAATTGNLHKRDGLNHRATEACILWSLAIRHAVLHGTYDGLSQPWTPSSGARRSW